MPVLEECAPLRLHLDAATCASIFNRAEELSSLYSGVAICRRIANNALCAGFPEAASNAQSIPATYSPLSLAGGLGGGKQRRGGD